MRKATCPLLVVSVVALVLVAGSSRVFGQGDRDYLPVDDPGCCVLRGDINHDGVLDIEDLVDFIECMFGLKRMLVCSEEINVNGSAGGSVDISDLVYLVAYMFDKGPEPPPCSDDGYWMWFGNGPY